MDDSRSRYDLTSADSKIVGFDFQYFYFINELLGIEQGQSIGYEVKDDVHITLPCGKLVLIQLKHTIQITQKGKPIKFTEKDDDLWKTLSNWCAVICDEKDGRKNLVAQEHFLQNTEFLLATNKVVDGNKFMTQVNKLKKDPSQIDGFAIYLSELKVKTKDTILQKYIETLMGLDSKILVLFIKHLNFVTVADDIIEETKKNIQKKMIASNRINDVFNDLYAELKQAFFKNVKSRGKQIITFDEWMNNYTCIFERHRDTALPIRHLKPALPPYLLDQEFIKELIEIGEIKSNDLAQIAEFSEFMLCIQMNLDSWCVDGLITNIDKENFHKAAFSIWRILHKKSHRSTKNNLSLNNTNALNCLDAIRLKDLKMLTTEIGVDLSNGEFYFLSNQGQIGWKLEWEVSY